MPLSLVTPGIQFLIKKVSGKDDMKQRLEKLGFVVGGSVKVISEMGGNLIINIKDSRIAISKEMANKILVA